MLPVSTNLPVSQLLVRINHDYARLTRSSAHKYIRSKRIFVSDVFEIIDHKQLVGNCFRDFMEVTVKATLKLKAPEPAAAEPAKKEPSALKKSFPNEPSTMKDFIKGLNSQGVVLNEQKKQKLTPQKGKPVAPVVPSPVKESKNAKKKRERKESEKKEEKKKLAKKIARQSESLSDSDTDGEDKKGEESDASVASSKRDAFIKTISESINTYSLSKASQDEQSATDAPVIGRLASSSSSSLEVPKKKSKKVASSSAESL